jgi:hypothetical protein
MTYEHHTMPDTLTPHRLDQLARQHRRTPGDMHASWRELLGYIDALTEAVETEITALDDVVEMVEMGGDIPTEITVIQNRLRAILEPHDA